MKTKRCGSKMIVRSSLRRRRRMLWRMRRRKRMRNIHKIVNKAAYNASDSILL